MDVDPLAGLTAPTDPRTAWDLPTFGALPPVERLDDVTTRVLAPNASPMTLDGTNTYVLAQPGAGAALLVDPGPDDPDHLARVEQVLADLDAEVASIVVTHHHVDHAAAAHGWARRFGCEVAAARPDVAGEGGRVLGHGEVVSAGGVSLTAVATPGHCADHLALQSEVGALLSGDHVLGRGTSVVAHPDGDLAAYLDSLRRVRDIGPHALYPGHGPALTEDPTAVVTYYLDHRAFREQQLLAVLSLGPTTPRAIVEVIYADVDRRVWAAAEASTRAGLDKLVAEGRVAHDGDTFRLVAD